MAKPDLGEPSPDCRADAAARSEVAAGVLLDVLSRVLRALHPFMPFITAELWQRMPNTSGYAATSEWPTGDEDRFDERAESEMDLLQDTVVKIRNLRAETGIDPGKSIDVLLRPDDATSGAILDREGRLIARLVRAESVRRIDEIADDLIAARGVVRGVQLAIPLEGLLDIDAEKDRLGKQLAKLDKELATRSRKLSNPSFLERAPADVVARERGLREELVEKKERLEAHLGVLAKNGRNG
jgi:valyl-tRNA synthetase